MKVDHTKSYEPPTQHARRRFIRPSPLSVPSVTSVCSCSNPLHFWRCFVLFVCFCEHPVAQLPGEKIKPIQGLSSLIKVKQVLPKNRDSSLDFKPSHPPPISGPICDISGEKFPAPFTPCAPVKSSGAPSVLFCVLCGEKFQCSPSAVLSLRFLHLRGENLPLLQSCQAPLKQPSRLGGPEGKRLRSQSQNVHRPNSLN